MKELPVEGIVEVHAHTTCTASDRQGWYCGFVYMDGQQCQETWDYYPQFPGTASRVFTREAVRAWIKAGGIV